MNMKEKSGRNPVVLFIIKIANVPLIMLEIKVITSMMLIMNKL